MKRHSRAKKKLRRWQKRSFKQRARRIRIHFATVLLPAWLNTDDPTATAAVHKQYRQRCVQRWYGPALYDARANWSYWNDLKPHLLEAMRSFHADRFQQTMDEKYQNPTGTLTDFIWKLQKCFDADGAPIYLIDFEERYQQCFLKRGLLIYCELLLRAIEAPPLSDKRQLTLI